MTYRYVPQVVVWIACEGSTDKAYLAALNRLLSEKGVHISLSCGEGQRLLTPDLLPNSLSLPESHLRHEMPSVRRSRLLGHRFNASLINRII